MANYFLDSSALTKRYIDEAGTLWVRSLTDPAALNAVYIVRITGVEMISAVTRRGHRDAVAAANAAVAILDFRHHYAVAYIPVEISPVLTAYAMDLAERHGLRGYDAIQLAAALEVQAECIAMGVPAITFISADQALNAAAIAEGLVADDPNLRP